MVLYAHLRLASLIIQAMLRRQRAKLKPQEKPAVVARPVAFVSGDQWNSGTMKMTLLRREPRNIVISPWSLALPVAFATANRSGQFQATSGPSWSSQAKVPMGFPSVLRTSKRLQKSKAPSFH